MKEGGREGGREGEDRGRDGGERPQQQFRLFSSS